MDFFSRQLGKGLVVETSPSESMFSSVFFFWRKIKSNFLRVVVKIAKKGICWNTILCFLSCLGSSWGKWLLS
jgi:hypothetical protein